MQWKVEQTGTFASWIACLRDLRAIARRVERLVDGNAGDAKSVGDGVSELRIDVGPGYRIHFTRRRGLLVILLCGGDKSSQAADIQRASVLAKEFE